MFKDLENIVSFADSASSDRSSLSDVELEIVDGFSNPKRRDEFIAGRIAAKLAIKKLKLELKELSIARGEFGEPLWPKGIVGSIAHSKKLAIAAVSDKPWLKGLGIDYQVLRGARREGLINKIARPEEREFVTDEAGLIRLFAAKESIYKSVFPVTNTFLGFMDASVDFNGENRFSVIIHKAKTNSQITGLELKGFIKAYQGGCLALTLLLEQQSVSELNLV